MGCASSNDDNQTSNMQEKPKDLLNNYFNKKLKRKPKIKKIKNAEEMRKFFDLSPNQCIEIVKTLTTAMNAMTKRNDSSNRSNDTSIATEKKDVDNDDTSKLDSITIVNKHKNKNNNSKEDVTDDSKDDIKTDSDPFPNVAYYQPCKLFNLITNLVKYLLTYNKPTKDVFVYPDVETYDEEIDKQELKEQESGVDDWVRTSFTAAQFLISYDTTGIAQTTFTHTATISVKDLSEFSQFSGEYVQHPYKPILQSLNKAGDYNYQFYMNKHDLDEGYHNLKAKHAYRSFIRVFSDNGDHTSCYLFFETQPVCLEQLQKHGMQVDCTFSFFCFGDQIGRKRRAMPLRGDPAQGWVTF